MNELKINDENNNSTLSRLQNMPGLNTLPSDCYGDDIDGKVEMLAVTFNDLYLRTKEELKGLFTKSEVMGITQAFCGTMISECNKAFLLMEIEDSIQLDRLDVMFGFDGTTLINKIKNLTEFQCMTVIGMLNEFRKASNGNIVSDEVLSKIFMIK